MSATVIALAACSTPVDDAGSSSTGETPSETSDPATSESGGVPAPGDGTAAGPGEGEPVVVAVMYPDLTLAAQLGLAEEIGDITPVFEAFVDDANEHGGIAGHEIELEMVKFDLLIQGDSVRACLTATQDLDAFAVIGLVGVFGDPVVCVTDQNETLMIGEDGYPEAYYEQAEGRLFSLTPSKERTQLIIMDAFADVLGSAPFAVLSSLDTGGGNDAVQATFLPALQAEGLEPAMTIVLDSDAEVAASQIPVEVEAVRSAGVETVVSAAGFFAGNPFSQALEAGGVEVQWIGSDLAGFASDLFASQLEPAQLDGGQAVTVHQLGWAAAGLDEPAPEVECRTRAAELLGEDVPTGSIAAGGAFMACNYIDLLADAGRLVAGELTTESMSEALQSLTEIELAGYGPASFGAGNYQAANAVRRVTWSAGCECWTAEGDFEPMGTSTGG